MIKSSLANHVQSEPDEIDRLRAARKLWHEHRKIVLHPDDDDLDWEMRQKVINLGNERYGKQA